MPPKASSKRKQSFPVTPSKRRTCGGGAAAAAAAEPATLVAVEPPSDDADASNGWATFMRRTREAGKFLDATLVAGGRKIEAHKAVLVSLSPYLDGLLTSGLAESAQSSDEVTVGDDTTDGRAVEAIVDLMYSGKLALSASSVGSVIRTANLLQVGAAENAACNFFVESLEPCTACDALSFAASFAECGAHARKLHERCLGYVVDHFEKCSVDPSFLKLPHEAVSQLVGSDDLPCDEEAVLSAVRAWFEHDAAERAGGLKSLVPLVRWPLLPAKTQLALGGEPLLTQMGSHATAMNLLLECLPAFAASDAAAACPRLRKRKGIPLPRLLFTTLNDTWTLSEEGARVTANEADDVAAICGIVMSSGKSCAEFTFSYDGDDDDFTIMIGLARPTLDVNSTTFAESGDFWGWGNNSGMFHHDGEDHRIDEAASADYNSYVVDDVLRLLVDSDAGTLTLKKNGTPSGVAPFSGLTGDMSWAVGGGTQHTSVRIKAVDPAAF